MDRISEYRKCIEKIVSEYDTCKSDDNIENQAIIDKKNDHYQVVNVGWDGHHRIYGCVFHIDIKDGKIWVQHDGTEIGITNKLLEAGIPKEDIVIGFHAEYKRKLTGFAIC